ncbi:MAG TPA: hypothetical protein VK879_15810 [Candidatus Sulfomarinibacteraceae bacterium]|nr:hypothetical protein [Candidatus Sulfomarinibacteraceae bacterium]
MARRKRRTRDEQPGGSGAQAGWQPNLLTLVAIAVLFSVVAALFLRSNQGRPLGLPGAYAWVSALTIAFVLRLLILARYVLPPEADSGAGSTSNRERERSWREGLHMLFYYFGVLAMPTWLRNRLRAPARQVPFNLPPSFAEFEAGFLESHRFLVLGRGVRFSRAAGPGYVHLQKGERIEEVVDLRRQERQQVVEAVTRDGIELEATITVSFRIRQPGERDGNDAPAPGAIPYPFDRDAAFRLTYADGMGPTSEIPWNERIHPRAAALLVAELSTYRLDELFLPAPDETLNPADNVSEDAVAADNGEDAMVSPIQNITHAVHTNLRDEELLQIFDCSEADECPVEILEVSVDRLQPPEDVMQERIESWQDAWQRRRARESAARGASPESDRARAVAMLRLVEHVMRDIEDVERAERRALCNAVLNNVTALIEDLVADGERHVLPQHNREALEDATLWLKDLPGPEDAR